MAFVNNVPLSSTVQVCVWVSVFSSLVYIFWRRNVGPFDNSTFSSWGTVTHFSTVASLLYIPINNTQVPNQIFHIHTNTFLYFFLNFNHSTRYKMISYSGFDLHSQLLMVLNIFYLLSVHLYIFFGESSVQVLWAIWIVMFVILLLSFRSS